MKKMVITGVNGFIGRHAKEYFEKEYEITGLDLAANYCGDRQPGDTMAYYQCNMSQESAEMAAIFTGVQPDVILHCAGSANVGASVVNPMADLDGNLHSLYQLLLALKSFEKDRRSFSSRVPESTAIRDSFRCASQTLRRRCPPMGCTSTWRRSSASITTGFTAIASAASVFFCLRQRTAQAAAVGHLSEISEHRKNRTVRNRRGDARFHSCLRYCTCDRTDPCL